MSPNRDLRPDGETLGDCGLELPRHTAGSYMREMTYSGCLLSRSKDASELQEEKTQTPSQLTLIYRHLVFLEKCPRTN